MQHFRYVFQNCKEKLIDKNRKKKYHKSISEIIDKSVKRRSTAMKKSRLFAAAAITMALSVLFVSAAFAQGWGQVSGKWFYYLEDGTVAHSTWVTTEGGSYYVNHDGAMAVNQWVNTDDSWFYVDASGNPVTSQLLKLDSKLYYFGEDARMVTNQWHEEEGKWYYLSDNGQAVAKGWHMIDGDYYYFLNSGVMAQDALVPGGYRVGTDGRWIQ